MQAIVTLARRCSGASAGLSEIWFRWRDSLLQSARFQQWAARFPLTRAIARKRSVELFDLVSGFVYSQVLAAVVRLKLLELVAFRPLPLDTLQARTGLPPDSLQRLCDAAVTLRLLAHRAHASYGLGDLGAALLGNPGVIAMVEHHAMLYRDLADPVALLADPARPTELSAYWAYASSAAPGSLEAERVADYSRLMGISQSFIASEILDAYALGRHRYLLDVGGGEGAFVCAAAASAPQLQFILFDLPAVAARAAQNFASSGLAGRARAVGGDLFVDSLPHGADLACLIRVLYDHPRERALAILRSVHAALPPGGVVLVAEPMADTPGAERVGAAYFAFYLLAMHGGSARSAGDIESLLREVGFVEIQRVRTRRPLLTSLISARR